MTPHRLPWRIVLPFAAFVLAGSVLLLLWMGWMISLEEKAKFETLARTNASFIEQAGLPPSDRMARQLGEVLGMSVFFLRQGVVIPEALAAESKVTVHGVVPDGRSHRRGAFEIVALPLRFGDTIMLARPAFIAWHAVWQPRTFAVLGAFWALAFAVGWLVSRGLVLPLRHLASRLPEIEMPGELDLPEALRADEIGDVARAFLRTREALQSERAQRERAEKLAVLGRMTAALAHEIQNPVSAIKMHAQLAAMDGDGERAEIIAGEAGRIENLVNQWMYLSRPDPPALAPVEAAEVVRAAVAAHSAQASHAHVEVVVQIEEPCIVQADRRRLAQVFSNLLVNAIQAMPMGGQVLIELRREASVAEISFSDTGPGFSPEAKQRFAEFFYSEKEGGMGIGLSVASEIVLAHGGGLKVADHPDGGARVTVRLPLSSIHPAAEFPHHHVPYPRH